MTIAEDSYARRVAFVESWVPCFFLGGSLNLFGLEEEEVLLADEESS